MGNEDLLDFTNLISCKGRNPELTLPNILPIKDINAFMTEPKNFNVAIDDLIKRQEVNAQQCRKVLQVLKERLSLKISTMQKLKKDLQDLHSEIKQPGADTRFVTNHEKVKVHFLDETEVSEHEVSVALERCNIKMSSIYCEILALDSDMGSVVYLERVSQINIEYIKHWYNTEKQNKKRKSLSAGNGLKPTI
ncbi:uncharacterized protein LOC6547494 [Drosophila erecta]|uniref:Uncharacterized protein n=1 Tax=Drosophila erecta TaxID=7220 RepID=B3NJS5_DROER|nr:uncharacterized protein LOC6547494 [Drosophila erecta]EDV55236.1 uncharacterized protein Dere_GG21989 [Drosophila erecta]